LADFETFVGAHGEWTRGSTNMMRSALATAARKMSLPAEETWQFYQQSMPMQVGAPPTHIM